MQPQYQMGYDRANVFLNELESCGLITKPKMGTKLPRTVIPKSMDDIPAKVMELLVRCGYTKDDVKNALNQRSGIANVQSDIKNDQHIETMKRG